MGCASSKQDAVPPPSPADASPPAAKPSIDTAPTQITTPPTSAKVPAEAPKSPKSSEVSAAAHVEKTKSPSPQLTFGETYELGDVIGEGAFSVVRVAKHRKTRVMAAVKCIGKQGLPADDEAALKQEVEILQNMEHPNILKCYGFFDEADSYYLVMEYMKGGELFDRIVKKTFYNEKEARDLVYILLSTIKYCHDRNVVHRDLKPENLLLTSPDDDANVKIADFGFAVRSNGYMALTTQCGTPGYVAPEILSTQPYGKAVDMWSIGVITYILLGGYPPFHDDNQKNLFKKIKNAEYEFHPEYWDAVSEEAKDLIRRLLKINPLERYTANEALQHPWIIEDAEILAKRNLDSSLAEFRKFHATRKFKAAAKAIMAANRMNHLIGSVKAAAAAGDV